MAAMKVQGGSIYKVGEPRRNVGQPMSAADTKRAEETKALMSRLPVVAVAGYASKYPRSARAKEIERLVNEAYKLLELEWVEAVQARVVK